MEGKIIDEATEPVRILVGDCREGMRDLATGSVQCCVTSPPYWGLRDYGIEGGPWSAAIFQPMPALPPMEIPAWRGCLGLEPDPVMFTAHLVEVFAEVYRVLADDGTLWVNFGDSYTRNGGSGGPGATALVGNTKTGEQRRNCETPDGLAEKNLVGIPWRFAFAMQAAGWVLRSEIIWAKPNPMPESVRDRPTKAHEQLFLFSKGAKYFYDTEAAREAVSGTANPRGAGTNPKAGKWKTPDGWDTSAGKGGHGSFHKEGREKGRTRPKQNESFSAVVTGLVDDRNWRDVWTIGTEPYKEAHFATFPTALPRRCILAGSRAGDLVLDPFGGSGTTAAVARELGRRAVICEANPEYAKLAESRIFATPPGLGI